MTNATTAQKADILSQALPYIQKYNNKTSSNTAATPCSTTS